jgi:alkylation response protein AidB-like acyl-CoA dehydrogenase
MEDNRAEREAWRQKAREIAADFVAPRAADIDAKGEFSWEIVDRFSQSGFLGLLIPQEYGGADADVTSFCAVTEEIARYCGSSGLLVIVQAVGTMPIVFGASPELKEVCLPKLAREKALAAFCLTEPETGSDAASIRTKAIHRDGDYVINGRKCFITNGGVSDYYTVFAVTSPEKKMEGITGFVVEKGTAGLSVGKTEEKMGIRGSNTTEVILEDVRVPSSQRIGAEGGAWWLMMRTLNRSRPAIGALALGIAQGALDYLLRFGRTNGWFEDTPGSSVLRARLADLAVEIEASRALVYKSAAMMDEKVKGIPVQMFSAMSKFYASDTAMNVTTEAVQLMGWKGLTQSHPVERMMRDAKVTQIFEGTNQVQRMVVAHTLLK